VQSFINVRTCERLVQTVRWDWITKEDWDLIKKQTIALNNINVYLLKLVHI